MPRTVPIEQRFWARVTKTDSCWNFAVTKGLKYGQIWFDGRFVLAHRLSYELYVGPIQEGLLVCHRCDNPTCVRPNHLFLGTYQDNRDDCMRKDRYARGTGMHARRNTARGERAGNSKLTAEQVARARDLISNGDSNKDVARALGVHRSTIERIANGSTWRESNHGLQ